HDQTSTWHPSSDLQDHLPGPIRDGFVPHLALFMRAFRRSQHTQKGQGPDPLRPGNRGQQHQRNPAQPIGFHKKLLARAHRITIDSSGSNLAASSALDRFIDAQDQWFVSWNKQAHQQLQQQATELSTRPGGTIEHASDAFWNCLSSEHPITLKMAATVRSPGARIAPITSTLAHSHTRSLKTVSKWRNTCIIPFGRVSIFSFSF